MKRSMPLLLLMLASLVALTGCGLGGRETTEQTPTSAPAAQEGATETVPAQPTMPAGEEASPTAALTGAATPVTPIATPALAETPEQPVSPAATVAVPTAVLPPRDVATPRIEPGPDGETPAPATAEPRDLPRGYRLFTSEINPYSIGYPRGWTARGKAFTIGGISGDAFFRGQGNNVVSVNVLREEIPTGLDLDTEQYLNLNIQNIERGSDVKVRRTGELEVAGEQAFLVQYTDQSDRRETEITQAIWLSDGDGWVATLATPPGRRARHLDTFRQMLSTFQPR